MSPSIRRGHLSKGYQDDDEILHSKTGEGLWESPSTPMSRAHYSGPLGPEDNDEGLAVSKERVSMSAGNVI